MEPFEGAPEAPEAPPVEEVPEAPPVEEAPEAPPVEEAPEAPSVEAKPSRVYTGASEAQAGSNDPTTARASPAMETASGGLTGLICAEHSMQQPPWRAFRAATAAPEAPEAPANILARLRRVQGVPSGASYRSTAVSGRSRFSQLR